LNTPLFWIAWVVGAVLGSTLYLAIYPFVTPYERIDELRCKRCGYDLRATPDRGPECGTMPADA